MKTVNYTENYAGGHGSNALIISIQRITNEVAFMKKKILFYVPVVCQ
jgi:hypothetical protein